VHKELSNSFIGFVKLVWNEPSCSLQFVTRFTQHVLEICLEQMTSIMH